VLSINKNEYFIKISMALKRIVSDYKDLTEYCGTMNVSAGPIVKERINEEGEVEEEKNWFKWEATIIGPSDTPYFGGLFSLSVVFPSDYPNHPPRIRFNTKVYHPNIDGAGAICLSTLKLPPAGDWSPALTIGKILLGISSLLDGPNPDDPLVPAIAKQYTENPTEFRRIAREWTDKYAS